MSEKYNRAFTTDPIGFMGRNIMTGIGLSGIGIVRLTEGNAIFDLHHHRVKEKDYIRLAAWSLESNEIPIVGYWVPQGKSCIIPVITGLRQYVFTPDLSGCSIFVDQLDKTHYKIYHVEGGSDKYQMQYAREDHGYGLAGQLTFGDYGTGVDPQAFAFLRFEGGRWQILYQSQTFGKYSFCNGVFSVLRPSRVYKGGIVPIKKIAL